MQELLLFSPLFSFFKINSLLFHFSFPVQARNLTCYSLTQFLCLHYVIVSGLFFLLGDLQGLEIN
jgi:hypothetical protein